MLRAIILAACAAALGSGMAAHAADTAPGSSPPATPSSAAPAENKADKPADDKQTDKQASATGSVPTPSPENASVYIIWPQNGAVITGGKFWLRMGLRNMGIAPKGVKRANVGHHHLLVDTELTPVGQQIPSDRNHLHFGAGETEARIELPPGKHTLQLLLGDYDHRPHDPPVFSKKITITVR